MSRASSTSAHARAKDRKIVLRAGTYVIGMPPRISSIARSFGTGKSLVNADPPNGRKSMSTTTCSRTPNRLAIWRAASTSCACRCP
jgi:hypothetical protein